jgi:hypothetical protein
MLFWIVVIVFIIWYTAKKSKESQKNSGRDPRKDAGRPGIYTAQTANPSGARKKETPTWKYEVEGKQKNPDILANAKKNVKKYEPDVTLEQLETEHEHTERSKRTVSPEEQQRKKEQHPHDAAHVAAAVGKEDESILGTVEDLMVKGYDGKLSFERDFVGEGMDMITRFTA